MSYTPHEWTTGETITAAKLNNIEEGIEEAAQSGGGGGGGTVFYEITTTNFPNGNNAIGVFRFIKKTGNTYDMPIYFSSALDQIWVNGNTIGCWCCYMPVPTLDDYYLALALSSGVDITSFSGNISQTPVMAQGFAHYIITGDFAITVKGWA